MNRHILDKLAALDDEIGRNWCKHASAAGSVDELLRIPIADGVFTTKIDGWIHAANVTTKSIFGFVEDGKAPQLDLEEVTTWTGGNAATRYGRWQADFHWKIDTRLWQYVLYLKFMRDAYRDAIDDAPAFTSGERAEVQRLVTEFFDQAEIALMWRWEAIERSRGFAVHPDATAGASSHGYSYEVTRPLPQVPFEHLPLGLGLSPGQNPGEVARILAGQSLSDEGDGNVIPPFPRVTSVVQQGVPTVAKSWVEEARDCGLADRWLAVRLADRMVPTRFDGWVAAIHSVTPFLANAARDAGLNGEVSGAVAPPEVSDLDLHDRAVRFALCQVAFQQRLLGGKPDLLELLQSLARAFQLHAADGHLPPEIIALGAAETQHFFERVARVIEATFDRVIDFQESWLPELSGRPMHPRFAPLDPVEPLPWEPAKPELYRRRMERLGYTI
ncbi:hypothetical protein EPN52_07015 [bacterium]|nr:MAG: hypothetical protein EPN52_07015 [bacterium]